MGNVLRRAWIAAAIGAVAVLAALPVGAQAKVQKIAGISYVSTKISVPASQSPAGAFRRYTAKCPRGTSVIGGGERNNSAFDQVRMAQSYPVDDGDANSKPEDGWGVLLQNVATAKHKGKVYAVCADVRPLYLSQDFPINGGTQGGQFDITCLKGTDIAAGGTRGHKLLFQNALRPLPIEEIGFYVDNFDDVTHSVTGTAICLTTSTTVVGGDSTALPGETRTTIRLDCPGPTHVLSGGQTNSGAFNVYAQSQFPSAVGGGAPDDRWNVAMENLGAPDRTGSGRVVCSPAL